LSDRPFLGIAANQGCQMVYFQTKNSHLGIFWRALEQIMLVYFVAIWNIVQPFRTFYGPLVYSLVIW
jgi:hypothetical protein